MTSDIYVRYPTLVINKTSTRAPEKQSKHNNTNSTYDGGWYIYIYIYICTCIQMYIDTTIYDIYIYVYMHTYMYMYTTMYDVYRH